MHADNLLETELGTAANETRKDATYAVLPGAVSPVKTPLAEPVFILQTEKVQADKFEAYRLEPAGAEGREARGTDRSQEAQERSAARAFEHHSA
jgi:hypothetical protein